MDMTAFKQFNQVDDELARFRYTDATGKYIAFVACIRPSWTWIVLKDDVVVAGRRSYTMNAFKACEEAIDCIEQYKSLPPQKPFFEMTEI